MCTTHDLKMLPMTIVWAAVDAGVHVAFAFSGRTGSDNVAWAREVFEFLASAPSASHRGLTTR